ncbi:MAG: hypothetical protein K2X74_00570 [Acetobacteraceae bacterium]|nr:hypothetical protein [Acetobacteraceae bacterium]
MTTKNPANPRTILRQGDVLLLPVAAPSPALRPVPPERGRIVLAHGEATGHHHSFAMSDRVALFAEDGAGRGLFLTITGAAPAALEHQEHSTLLVVPGTWEVRRQREWSDADEPIQVAD